MNEQKSSSENKDLTVSTVDRQNILNNPFAIKEIEKAVQIKGIPFEGKTVVLKEQVASFFEVTIRTIENYLKTHEAELIQNGYEVLKGNRLKILKESISTLNVPETDFGNIAKSPQLGVLGIKAFLNLAMIMVESQRARLLRSAILVDSGDTSLNFFSFIVFPESLLSAWMGLAQKSLCLNMKLGTDTVNYG